MLKEGSFTKIKFNKLLYCALLGWVVSLLGGMADSIIAGIYLDAEAVSAVGLITPIVSVSYFFALLIGCGTGMVFSKTQGAFNYDKAKKIAGMGLLVSLVLGIIIGAVLFFGKEFILGFYGIEGQLLEYSLEYYIPIIAVCALYPVIWTVYNLVNYDGDEKVILLVDLSMAVSNSVFSLVLISKFGIAGLGYGTVISTVLGLLLLVIHFFKKSNSIHFEKYFSWKDLTDILKSSSATSLTTLYIGIIDIIFNKLVIILFGEVYLTAYAVINVVMNFACALMCTINAGVIFATVSYGENNPYAIKRIMDYTNRQGIILSIILTVVMEVLASYWPSIYSIVDPDVYAVALFAGRIIPVFFIASTFVYTYQCYYPAVDKFVEGNILVLTYMLIGPLVLAVPMAYTFGFNAMSLGFALTPLLSLLVAFIYIAITKQLKYAPLLVAPTDEIESHYDFKLDLDSITHVRDEIAIFLSSHNVDEKLIIKIQMVFEDSMVFIMNRNTKKVICECSVLLNDSHVRLLLKDNGVIFDLVSEADNSVDLQAYVIARMMSDSRESTNSVTTSFNRNVCIWER